MLLEAEPDFVIVGEASDGLEAIALVEQLRPDILVVDVMMPGVNGLEVTRQVSNRLPETRIVILSMHSDEAYVLEALRNGASGYVLKDSSASDLVQALREVSDGRRYLSPPLSERAIEAYVQRSESASIDPYDRLTISTRTAETHRASVMRKLNLRTQTELIRYALRRGILPMDE